MAPTAIDNCGSSVTLTKISGLLIGSQITNTWTAKDAVGNTSAIFTQVITIGVVTIDASDSSTPVAFGTDAILSAKVTPVEAGISVTFKLDQGTAAYGTYGTYTVTTDASGVAKKTVTGLAVEVYRVYAIAGDGCANSTAYLAVYDPTGGFVTGGGWINSPDGALIGTHVIGKANFGFNSKYEKGKTTPTGNTEFQFQTGNLNFSSSTYVAGSLVIAGSQAIYKGVGTINGVSGYSFMVSAVDGDVTNGGGVDKFRIKIWLTSTGAIVYDNNVVTADNATPTTALGGGSIVIHPADKTTKSAEITTAVGIVETEPTLKAYPNPFTEKLNIEFSYPNNTQAKLEIYNIAGSKLETLFDGPVEAGVLYKFEYLPKLVSSQVVLYKLILDGKTQVGKMIYNERR